MLFEMGVHHFDICRYLCDAEILDLRAHEALAQNHAAVLSVQARLSSDILATCVIGEDLVGHNSIELLGDRGRMVISCYRFDGLYVYPRGAFDGGMGLRLQHAREMLSVLPRAFSEQRNGGMYVSSYRREWEHFFQVVRHHAAPLAAVRDGAAATRAARAARASLQ
jgi:predicted dehydrogenase